MTTVIYGTRVDIRKVTGYADGDKVLCYQDNGVYQFSAAETTTDDDETYLKPYDTIVGRWVKVKELQMVNLG